ncbi:hypothetical protein [Nodosilinea nodulosa]|uniref:hypothetical protein n=1 Tax=Nodosilinea nodulosa TaxID=416001 RepID=UPI00037D15C6|nr:hypothetical protein [Nodosilinea nodulosa]
MLPLARARGSIRNHASRSNVDTKAGLNRLLPATCGSWAALLLYLIYELLRSPQAASDRLSCAQLLAAYLDSPKLAHRGRSSLNPLRGVYTLP